MKRGTRPGGHLGHKGSRFAAVVASGRSGACIAPARSVEGRTLQPSKAGEVEGHDRWTLGMSELGLRDRPGRTRCSLHSHPTHIAHDSPASRSSAFR
jgi:hypothetical protein